MIIVMPILIKEPIVSFNDLLRSWRAHTHLLTYKHAHTQIRYLYMYKYTNIGGEGRMHFSLFVLKYQIKNARNLALG